MKKKIVILSAFVTPFRSGAEACSEEVSARLNDEFDITIVAARMRRDLPYLDYLPLSPGPFPPSTGSGQAPEGERGVRVWRVGLGYKIDKWLYPFLAPFAARALKPDIIHAVLESYAGLAMVFCKRLVPSAKRILTCQSTNTSFLIGTMHRAADTVTVISSVLKSRATQFGKDAVLIPNGIRLDLIDEALKHRPKIEGRILYVGRLEQMKGVDTLLRAFAKLIIENGKLKMDSTANLRIVGDGSERSRLEKLAHDLKITDRITFVGRVSPEKVAEEFAQASIFCGLSRSEALGNVFLEAQAAGCAVVATNVGGIPDIVKDGETGLLVGPDNVEAAAGVIRRLLEDDALRANIAENGQKHAQDYDWGVIAEKYAQIYHAQL
jgi:glycosyltransferase involved in cell wall biosynthesis